MSLKKAVLMLIILVASRSLRGQHKVVYAPYYRFDIFTTKDGLSNNRINDIFQDSHGILWIATENGLNRFDGYDFKTFFHSHKDFSSIAGNIVASVCEDAEKNLWIGSNGGLDIFDRRTDGFKHVFPFDSSGLTRESMFVMSVLPGENGIVWFDTADGILYKYNIETGIYSAFKHEKPGQVFTYYNHDLFDDKKGNLWIGGRGINTCKFDKKTEVFKYYKTNPLDKSSKRDKDVAKYYIDNKGEFWIGGVDGLFRFANGRIHKFISGTTYDIIDFNNNELWFSNGLGLKIYNRMENKIFALKHSDENKYSIPSNYIFKLYKDNAGNMWMGTMNGLCRYSPHKNKFKSIFHIYGDKKTISSNHITALIQDEKGDIWVGTKNNGIDIVDTDFIRQEHLDNSENSRYRLSSNRISTLYQDSKNNIFIGLWAGIGFDLIDKKNNNIKLLTLDKTTKKLDWYNDFFEDSNSNFWIGTWGSYSLVPFDVSKKDFIKKPLIPRPVFKNLGSHFISCINELKKGKLIIGTTNRGMTIFDTKTEKARYFTGKNGDSTSLWGQNIACIFKDMVGNIWVGAKGLNRFNPEDNTFKHFTKENGLCDNEVKAILEDNNGDLWISTSNGLSRFDKEDKIFVNYYEKGGLTSDEFTSAALKLKDGRLVFGSNFGLTVVDPEKILFNKHKPVAAIRTIKIFEKAPLENEYDGVKVDLKYNRNYITFDFVSNDLSDVDNNLFAYKLKGFDEKWHFAKNGLHKATYTYMEPGKYEFLLKTANPDKVWSDIMAIPVVVNPPFWKTWWFILLEIIILVLIFYAYIKYREAKLKEKHFMETLEQRLLRSQMNPHFIFNALGAIQSYIFSHNPIEAGSYLSKFADLMRSILYGSREEYISLSKEIEALRNYLEIQQLRFEDKFEFDFEVDSVINTDFIKVPPMLIQPFLENSIEHGFKNLSRKGFLKIKITKEVDKLKFEIIDNGTGLNTKSSENLRRNRDGDIVLSKKHKSLSLQITRKRLAILNKDKKGKYELKISNITDTSGKVKGTKVTFYIPVIVNTL